MRYVPFSRRGVSGAAPWITLLVFLVGPGWALADSDAAASEKIVELKLVPGNPILTGSRATQRVLVSGHFADGSVRDLTKRCRFESADPEIAAISPEGVIQPITNGAATVRAVFESAQVETSVTVQRVEDRSLDFAKDVLPVLARLGCNQMGCHGSPKGKNGFRLSLFSADPAKDYRMITHERFGRLISPPDPPRSLMLKKGTAAIPHGGGKRLSPDSKPYRLLAEWIAQQTPEETGTKAKLVRIEVFPAWRVLREDSRQPLLVEAYYSDGTMADVTDLAHFSSGDELIAIASPEGEVQATGTGEAMILASFSGRMAVSRLAIPQALATPFPEIPTNNRIDELVLAKLRTLNIVPSELSGDSEFLRRIYLDVLGTLPTPEEVRRFLSDTSSDKRSRLIDELLERTEFVDRRALKWSELLGVNRGFPHYLRDKGMWAYYLWVRHSIARNKPMDQFVHELVTAQGANFHFGPANYFCTARDPQKVAEQTATLFLGVRLDCAHCHNHPFEQITLDDNLGMAAFFARMRRKRPPIPMANNDAIVYLARSGSIRHPDTKQVVQPRFLGGPVVTGVEERDPRVALARWITAADNPYFARNMVNRVWYWLMGRGIVHEPDDFRSTNPPSNPELLDYLADEFVGSGYDMKHIFRLVLASRTYQISSRPNPSNRDDRIHFSHYPIRRLDAEQMLDALSAATGAPDKFPGLPPGTRAAQLPDAYVRSVMLDLFGRPMRATSCECERSNEMHIGQTLHLMSSEHVEDKLVAEGARLSQLLASDLSDEAIVEELYLACLSRLATDEEKKTIFAEPIPTDRRREWFEDLLWTLANTKEFLFNH